jgi:pilus assembly protein Flp/PilA
MIKKLMNLFKDEEGATMVEYGLMVALIAIVCIVVITSLGSQLNIKFNQVATAVSAAGS